MTIAKLKELARVAMCRTRMPDGTTAPLDPSAITTFVNLAPELIAVVEASRNEHRHRDCGPECTLCAAHEALDTKLAQEKCP